MRAAVIELTRRKTIWPIYIYLILSVTLAISAGINAGISAGLAAVGTSVLCLVAGSGLKAALWYGDKLQKIYGPFVAAAILGLAIWIGTGFSVQIFGQNLTGPEWGIIGAVVCFIFTNRKLAT